MQDELSSDADEGPCGRATSSWSGGHMMVIDRRRRSYDISGMLASPLVRDGGLLVSVVGVSDTKPWCSVVVAVSHDRVSWLEPADGTLVSITTDAIDAVQMVRLDAPPRPVFFDVEVHPDRGEVTVAPDGQSEQRPIGRLRATLLHHHLHTVRLTEHDASQLQSALRQARASENPGQTLRPTPAERTSSVSSVMPWC